MKRRPTHIPHIPGQRRRGVNVPNLPKAWVSRRGETWPENRNRRRNKTKTKSGCGFPFWLVILAFIGWNMVGDDVDWSWLSDQLSQTEDAEQAPLPDDEVPADPPIVQLPPPPPIDAPDMSTPSVTGPTPPRGALANLFTADDYPSSALRNDEEGIVRARLIVGVDGRVRDCTVVRSSGSSALDTATCDIFIRRSRFDPARDASGNAVEGSLVTPAIRWVIP
ncbi:energy transducer TonB [Sphingomicrobium marinum]|uniref:energy transducer TonB n=1 Tax=Sphingomicrobium marinum TaxID=1227950 RepID=UPI00223F881D|nr:energy transducer TonB [Sphingomicrobium marinum]